ncbi:MAG: tetrahydromethanopterin-linked C1 transfer pathway [Pirellulales bacterium]|nr:tetrahydromethanopterin-linked C1 transfer pathway [Pirellulales bacterium]
MAWLGLDIGGAHLKVADTLGYARSLPFPLWRTPNELPAALQQLLASAPAAERVAVTMTGELADCYTTKAEGVASIVAATLAAAGPRQVAFYRHDGNFVESVQANAEPLLVAAANWHALASFACRYVPTSPGLLIDIGSTTTDLIPLVDGAPRTTGHTDPERMLSGELVYTGVVRTPVCAATATLPWRGAPCPVAAELFATTLDAYLTLEDLAEDSSNTETADGRAATRAAAHDRLARAICADRTMFSAEDARAAAEAIASAQLSRLGRAAQQVLRALSVPPQSIVVSGQGEFLARRMVEKLRLTVPVVSLAERLGGELSRAATAHAVAVLAEECYL